MSNPKKSKFIPKEEIPIMIKINKIIAALISNEKYKGSSIFDLNPYHNLKKTKTNTATRLQRQTAFEASMPSINNVKHHAIVEAIP